ncbi:MAG: DUF502 domain-containing protein [Kiritimatiellaeota bacterium]|nr:DUF502 domain-containing protein [Kiritimatiellota bacterium]
MQNPPPPSLLPRQSRLSSIRNRIFAGILFVTPVMATIWIFNSLLNLATAWFPKRHFPEINMLGGYLLKLLVLLVIVLLLYIIGLISFYLGKRLTRFIDSLFASIPLISTIYKFLKQFRDWIENRSESMFDSVVLIRYPHPGCYTIGLMTAGTAPVIADHIRDENGQPLECINVFISTTPNPTTGFYLIYPKRDVVFLDMDVNTALNLIISAGAIMTEKAGREIASNR